MKSKIRLCIYGSGEEYNKIITSVNALRAQVEVKAVITTFKMPFSSIDGYICCTPEEMDWNVIDFVVVASADWTNILKTLSIYGIGRERIIASSVFRIPFIDIHKYIDLKKSTPTLLANSCLAGIIYNELDLPFTTPTIASVCNGNDYIKFLKEYDSYLEMEMKQCFEEYNDFSVLYQEGYPVGIIGDVKWYFVHSLNVVNSIDEWNKRRKRINKDNVVALMIIENEEQAYEFDSLNIKHKIGFFWKNLGLESVVYIPGWENYECRNKYNWYFRNLVQDVVTNTFESGKPAMIDWIDFLNGEHDYRRYHFEL